MPAYVSKEPVLGLRALAKSTLGLSAQIFQWKIASDVLAVVFLSRIMCARF